MQDQPLPPDDAVFRERLQTEVNAWRDEGLVNPDQAQGILSRYGFVPDETPGTLRASKLVFILAVLGVVLVGTGAILLIGANWEYIPKWARLALLLISTAAVYHTGYVMAYRSNKYPKVGMALLLLGSILWGTGIFLVAQSYHLGGEGGESRMVLYWFIGVLPLAYVLLSPLHMALSLMIGSVWLGMSMANGYGDFFEEYLVMCLPLGVLLYSLSRIHAYRASLDRLDPAYRWFGLRYISVALYAFSFRDFWGPGMISYGISIPTCIVLGLGVVATVTLMAAHIRRDKAVVFECIALVLLLLLGLGIVIWPTPRSGYYDLSLTTTALFNLLLFAWAIGVIALGWFRNQPGLANLGLFVFFVQVVTRYFDLLGGMLSGGLMFIGAGILLIGGGFGLERSRRRLIESMANRRAI